MNDYVSKLAQTTANAVSQKIDARLQSTVYSADALARLVSASKPGKPPIRQMIPAVLSANPTILGMTVALQPGALFADDQPYAPYFYRDKLRFGYVDLADKDYHYQDRPWYRTARQFNLAFWSSPYLDEGGGNILMTTYSSPIRKPSDESFAGAVTADVGLDWLQGIAKSIQIQGSGFGFIVDQNNTILAHPDTQLVMKNLLTALQGNIPTNTLQHYLKSKQQTASHYFYTTCKQNGGYCWVAVETLNSTSWKVIIVVPEQALTNKIIQLSLQVITLATVGLILLVLLIHFLSHRFTRPLTELSLFTDKIGKGQLDTPVPPVTTNDEVARLAENFELMRIALKHHIQQITEYTAQQEKLTSEMRIASEIQLSMLPGQGQVTTTFESITLFAHLTAARQVGGDFYYYERNGDILSFIIGDVSDKGTPAALLMARTVTLYSRGLKDRLSPGNCLTMMNDILSRNNDNCMFVTALCGEINLCNGQIAISNAGHISPIIKTLSDTAKKEIDGTAALALMEDIDYPETRFILPENACMVMFTDGISKAHNLAGEQYGEEQLLSVIRTLGDVQAEKLGRIILSQVDTFTGNAEAFDDLTLVVVERSIPPA